MVILAIDTATPVASVAVVDESRTVAASYLDAGLQHSRHLFEAIAQVLGWAGLGATEVWAVAVTIGPGSFTGLRIGLSAAKGLCLGAEAGLIPVPTLDVLAARLPFAAHPVCALLDARKGEVYAAVYDTASGLPRTLSGARALCPQRLAAERAGEATIYTGDGVAPCRQALDALCPDDALYAPTHCSRPEAGVVGHLALARLRTAPDLPLRGDALACLAPDYVRAPDARLPGQAAGAA